MGNFDKKVEIFIEQFIDNGGYNKVLEGLKNTLLIAVIGLLIGTVIGILIAAVRVMPKYKTLPRVLNGFCTFYVGFFRGTPIVVQLLLFYYVLLPLMGLRVSAVMVSIIVFGLNSGAYISEMMRAGILSVDSGQMEGGRAMGLIFGATMKKIVSPQAIKNIPPTMGNEFIALIKETSVVSFITVADLKYLLTCLIRERVSIKNIVYLFEKINDYANEPTKEDLLDKVRLAFSKLIIKDLAKNGEVKVIEFSDETLEKVDGFFDSEDGENIIRIDACDVQEIANKINKIAKNKKLDIPILAVPMDIRHMCFVILSEFVPNLRVLACEELVSDYNIKFIGKV